MKKLLWTIVPGIVGLVVFSYLNSRTFTINSKCSKIKYTYGKCKNPSEEGDIEQK